LLSIGSLLAAVSRWSVMSYRSRRSVMSAP
jgi:hypothetical protein